MASPPAADAAKRSPEVKDGRVAAVYALRAAKNAVATVGAAQNIANGSDPVKDTGLKLSIALVSRKSQATSTSQQDIARGDTLTASRDINITATGDTNPNTSPENKVGSNINLSAARDITLQSATNAVASQSNNKSSNASFSVAIRADKNGTGISVFANTSAAKGHTNGQWPPHTESTLTITTG